MLVRLVQPPSQQGKLLSSANVPKDRWEELGLYVRDAAQTLRGLIYRHTSIRVG